MLRGPYILRDSSCKHLPGGEPASHVAACSSHCLILQPLWAEFIGLPVERPATSADCKPASSGGPILSGTWHPRRGEWSWACHTLGHRMLPVPTCQVLHVQWRSVRFWVAKPDRSGQFQASMDFLAPSMLQGDPTLAPWRWL